MAGKEELIKDLAEKYHIDPDKVRKAVNAQFKFVRKKIASGKFPEIRLPYFGLFKAKESRIKHLQNSKNKNNDGNSRSRSTEEE